MADPATTALARHKMVTQRSIYPVLNTTPVTSTIGTFLELIRSAHSPDFDFYERIERCHVTKVTHYRSKSAHAHEIIVIEMTYIGADKLTETRLFRLERFRIDFVKDSERAAARGWTKLSQATLYSTLQSPDRHDSVTVSDRLTGRTGGLVSDDYRVVREFDVPRGKLLLLEALVIADTLCALTVEYSNLVHICQLWAVNLFVIMKTVVSTKVQHSLKVRYGPAAGEAGTCHGLKIVDIATGCASPELLDAGSEQLQKLVGNLSAGNLAEPETRELVAAIRRDIQLLHKVIESRGFDPKPNDISAGVSDNFMSVKRVSLLAQSSLELLQKRLQNTIEERVREQFERSLGADRDITQGNFGFGGNNTELGSTRSRAVLDESRRRSEDNAGPV
ncbi:hypothetical protein BKA62DRAFT_757731 [Auriculariales sp. MPI-PUGE-AT-0066]|nr:hypothetical protein BKA62DRAFT_757731 [Auriculariales sp. MPI-PUGE-AT-0066]